MTIAVAEEREITPIIAPPKPLDFEDTGLSGGTISSLIVKLLHGGEATGMNLADRVCLPYGILEPFLEYLRTEQLIEVKSAAGTGTAGYRYALTDAGRNRALKYIEACGRCVGPAPVPLPQYTAHMASLRAQVLHIHRDRVEAGFDHLIVEPEMVDQLGPAIASRRAVFLYGPPGNGKSVMGEGIGRVLGGDIYIPYALDVDGQIIMMYDPVNHEARPIADENDVIRPDSTIDRRWIRVRRPVITVGGELTLEMLDLRYRELSAFYEAPVQLKSNGGVLVVDDFGRQRVAARDLLNRWIVPLESRVDYLNLQTGQKFQVPFDVMVVFATNLDPLSLADEAFLRRIPYKVLAKNPTIAQYERIFDLNCRRHGITFNPTIVQYLRERYYIPRKLEMRACHPRDLTDHVVSLCHYHRRRPELTTDLLDAVCQSYFLEDSQSGITAAAAR